MARAMRWASATMATIRASVVSAPVRSTRISKLPVPLMVPPVTRSPLLFSTGSGSPVSSDSSTALLPSITVAVDRDLVAGADAQYVADGDRLDATSARAARCHLEAVFGARSSSARIAPPVRARARSSST